MTFRQRLNGSLRLAICVLILTVTVKILAKYVDYFPPNFMSDFLRDRRSYFFGSYQWAFYPHLIAGPLSLVLGMILLSDKFRSRFTPWHSRLGRVQIACVLLVLAPSGFWMALHAHAGPGIKLGFALLAVATALSGFLGFRLAIQRRFIEHRLWMWRCYVLLCSAVVTRLIGGTLLVTEIDGEWTYYLSAWASWLVPLSLFELTRSRTFPASAASPKASVTRNDGALAHHVR